MGIHGKTKIGVDTQLARNNDGSFSLLLFGRCVIRLYEDHLVLRTFGARTRPLADRLGTVLALWDVALVIDAQGTWCVRRANQTVRLREWLRVPYAGPLAPAPQEAPSGYT